MITEGQWWKMMIKYWSMMTNTNPPFHWITSPIMINYWPMMTNTYPPSIAIGLPHQWWSMIINAMVIIDDRLLTNYDQWPMMINTSPSFHWITSPMMKNDDQQPMMINYWPMMINTNPFFHWITSPPSATSAQQPTFDHRHSPTITRHQLSEQPINHYLLKTKTFHQRNTQIHSKNTNAHIFKYKTLFPLNHNASITRRKHPKNCEYCPVHYLIVNHYSSI